MIQITIPKKTLTINHLYGFRGYRKFLTKEGRELRQCIIGIVKKEKAKRIHIQSERQRGMINQNEPKLSVSVDIYENWLTKKGLVARKDIANREKFLIDSVFEALGIDDKFIWIHKMTKVQSETEEKAIIKIEEIK